MNSDIRNLAIEMELTRKKAEQRALFASMAMQAMALKDRGEYSQGNIDCGTHLLHAEWVAQSACDYADALIKALEKKNE